MLLPKVVRDAFVEDENLCDRPLTQRRLKAVMTAASQTLGYASLAELKKFVTMNMDLREKIGGQPDDDTGSSIVRGEPVVNPVRDYPVGGEDLDDSIASDDDDRLYADEEDFDNAVGELAEEKAGDNTYTTEELFVLARVDVSVSQRHNALPSCEIAA